MENWLTHIRHAIGTGFLWAFGGVVAASFIERFIDPAGHYVDVWTAVLAYPGFFGGVIFFTLVRMVEGPRSFAELSLPRAAAWGAGTALLLAALVALVFATGLEVKGPGPDSWLVAAMIGAAALSFAVAACVSVAIARIPAEHAHADRQAL